MENTGITTAATELQFVMEKLVSLHRNLVELLREEYSHMAKLDIAGLADTAHSKEVMLSEIWNYEQVRIRAADHLAAELHQDPKVATLLTLAGAMTAIEGDKLRSARTALNMLITQAKESNQKNMSFAESSLGRIDEMKKNVLGLNNNTNKENYSNSGVCQPMPGQGGRLLSTEA